MCLWVGGFELALTLRMVWLLFFPGWAVVAVVEVCSFPVRSIKTTKVLLYLLISRPSILYSHLEIVSFVR